MDCLVPAAAHFGPHHETTPLATAVIIRSTHTLMTKAKGPARRGEPLTYRVDELPMPAKSVTPHGAHAFYPEKRGAVLRGARVSFSK